MGAGSRWLLLGLAAALGLTAVGAANGVLDDVRDGALRPGDWALIALAVALAGITVAAVARRRRPAPEGGESIPPPLRGAVSLLPVIPHLVTLLVLLVLAVLLGVLPDDHVTQGEARRGPEPPAGQPAAPGTPEPAPADERRAVESPAEPGGGTGGGIDARLALLAAAVAAVGMLLLLRAARGGAPADAADAPETAAGSSLADAVAASMADLDDLAGDPDHRRVVIRAYARMERALAVEGVARHPAEAPFEYLGRALSALGVAGEAASRLTTLFERARFSRDPIDADDRAEAVRALDAVRGELAGTVTVR